MENLTNVIQSSIGVFRVGFGLVMFYEEAWRHIVGGEGRFVSYPALTMHTKRIACSARTIFVFSGRRIMRPLRMVPMLRPTTFRFISRIQFCERFLFPTVRWKSLLYGGFGGPWLFRRWALVRVLPEADLA